ncbi:lectin-like protein [Algoriphagus aquimarinus]|uniref:lectin-like protein n=1 Tax=Algoriphagus aquimarinus TaxID=237018 RepID=UPI0030DAD60C
MPLLLMLMLTFLGCSDDGDLEVNEQVESRYSFTYDGSDYTVVKEAISWQEAFTKASEDGGYLAEISSEEEQVAILSELLTNAGIYFDKTNNQFGFAAVWIGGNDEENEGAWVWKKVAEETGKQFWQGAVDGTVVNGLYNNWGNEPDNNGNQDALCVGLEATPINAVGKWTDLGSSENSLFYLIEYD